MKPTVTYMAAITYTDGMKPTVTYTDARTMADGQTFAPGESGITYAETVTRTEGVRVGPTMNVRGVWVDVVTEAGYSAVRLTPADAIALGVALIALGSR